MKTMKITLTALVLIIASFGVNAQTIMVKLLLAENSNNLAQQHNPVVIGFDTSGNHVLQFPDAGNESYFGQLGTSVYPFTKSSDGFVISNYDARPELTSYMSIPFGIASKDTGDVKIIGMISCSNQLPPPALCVWIENLVTGERFSVMDTVKLRLSDNSDFDANYLIHVSLPCSNVSTDEICFGMNNGSLHVTGPNYPGFTHELTYNGSPYYNSVVAGIDTLVNNLAPGHYVSVIRINNIPVDSSDIYIQAAAPIIADFASDYNYITEGDVVNFTDNSIGALSYIWDFGDGDSSTTAGSESHQFTVAGSYTVTLLVADALGCTSNTYDIIEVNPASPPSQNYTFNGGHGLMSGPSGNNPLNVVNSSEVIDRSTISNQYLRLTVTHNEEFPVTISIVSANGAVIAQAQQADSIANYELPAPGVYIVTIVYTDGTNCSKTILAQ